MLFRNIQTHQKRWSKVEQAWGRVVHSHPQQAPCDTNSESYLKRFLYSYIINVFISSFNKSAINVPI